MQEEEFPLKPSLKQYRWDGPSAITCNEPGKGSAAAGRGCVLNDNVKSKAETPANKAQTLKTSDF